MKVDTEGNVYCASKTGVMVFDRTGKHLGTFSLPNSPPTAPSATLTGNRFT